MLMQIGIGTAIVKSKKRLSLIWQGWCGLMAERWVNLTHKSLEFTDWLGFHYQLLPGDEIGVYWKRQSVNDATHIIRFILENITEGMTCIDIGSHIGGVSIPMWSKVGKSGKVISVEADHRNVERIKANLQLNGKYSVNPVIDCEMKKRSVSCKVCF